MAKYDVYDAQSPGEVNYDFEIESFDFSSDESISELFHITLNFWKQIYHFEEVNIPSNAEVFLKEKPSTEEL